MWIWYLLLGFLIVMAILFVLIIRGFKNPVLKYQKPYESGFEVEDVWFPAKNGKRLHGWFVSSGSKNPTIILVHGWGKNAERMTPYIKGLCCRGYNIFAFDSRNHGLSDPDGYSSMLKFAEDIISSIDYLEKREDLENKTVFLIGLSIGGGASLYAASHDKRIKKVVTVGAFADPRDVMRKEIEARHIPYFPLIWLFFKFLEWHLGVKLQTIAPVNNISKSNAEILLIHGKKDKVVPFEQAEKLMTNKGNARVQLWAIENRGHSNCHLEPGFWGRLDVFFKV